MSVPSEEFRDYLAPDESVVSSAHGTVVDGSFRSRGSIGITDRRVLFVTDSDRFLDVTHDAIASIRGRQRTGYTTRGVGYRLAVVTGALIAVAGFVGVLGVQANAETFTFALATVGGAAVAEYGRRSSFDVEWPASDEVLGALTADRTALGEVLADVGFRRSEGADGDDAWLVFVPVLGAVSLVSLIGLVGVTGRLLVVPLVVVALAGLALADYAHRRTRALDAAGNGRRRERAVSIDLVNGRTVTFRVDSTERIDRDLSGVVREATGEYAVA